MLAIIGGSGLSRLSALEITHRQVVRTPYGEPSCALAFGRIAEHTVVFLARHGYGHSLAPHEINYRANIWALAEVGVKHVIAVSAVGGIRQDMMPGQLVIPDQLIDYTSGRGHTFYEGPGVPVVHADFTWPYDDRLRQRLISTAANLQLSAVAQATYAVTQGPRLESAAEIRRIARDGGDIVGMTGMPEAALAREKQLAYASLAIVSNWAAGVDDSAQEIHFRTFAPQFEAALDQAQCLIQEVISGGV